MHLAAPVWSVWQGFGRYIQGFGAVLLEFIIQLGCQNTVETGVVGGGINPVIYHIWYSWGAGVRGLHAI